MWINIQRQRHRRRPPIPTLWLYPHRLRRSVARDRAHRVRSLPGRNDRPQPEGKGTGPLALHQPAANPSDHGDGDVPHPLPRRLDQRLAPPGQAARAGRHPRPALSRRGGGGAGARRQDHLHQPGRQQLSDASHQSRQRAASAQLRRHADERLRQSARPGGPDRRSGRSYGRLGH